MKKYKYLSKTLVIIFPIVIMLLGYKALALENSYKFTRNLTIEFSGEDVSALQTFLEQKGFLTIPSGVAKGYFGLLTKKALIKYQISKGILPAVGYFGPITRKSFAEVQTVQINIDLLIIQTEGGLCEYGGCSSKIIIRKDGTFISEIGNGEKKSGNLDINSVKNLQNLIENSNYLTLRKTLFTDTCPTAYDGSKFIYKFRTLHGEEIIDSCKTKIDLFNPLFQEIQNILNSINSYIS